MTALRRVWNILGSMSFGTWLLLCVAVLFFTGSIFYEQKPEVFVSLNSAMLPDWFRTFGIGNIGYTWWFFVALIFLFLLGLSTGICTLQRMIRIIGSRNNRSIKATLFLLSPHIIHLAFLVIMLGYLSLYTFGINSYNNILKPGFSKCLPGSSITMELRDPSFSMAHNLHNKSLQGLHVGAEYTLLFHDGEKTDMRKVGLNRPCIYKGYSIHVVDFNPQRTESMTDGVWVKLTIIKNMGIPIFMIGVLIFAAGVFLYILSAFTSRQ